MRHVFKKVHFLSFLFSIVLLSWIAGPAVAKDEGDYIKHPQNYTVEQAYEFFGHERTPFDAAKTSIPENEARYLDHLFFAADMAMQARVNMMQYYFAGTTAHKKYLPAYLATMQEIGESFALTRAPTKDLKDIEKLFLLALSEQRDFFIQWSNTNGNAFITLRDKYKDNELVQSSHAKLQRVYTNLMLLYPNEASYNHKAFYNHLCALDFI